MEKEIGKCFIDKLNFNFDNEEKFLEYFYQITNQEQHSEYIHETNYFAKDNCMLNTNSNEKYPIIIYDKYLSCMNLDKFIYNNKNILLIRSKKNYKGILYKENDKLLIITKSCIDKDIFRNLCKDYKCDVLNSINISIYLLDKYELLFIAKLLSEGSSFVEIINYSYLSIKKRLKINKKFILSLLFNNNEVKLTESKKYSLDKNNYVLAYDKYYHINNEGEFLELNKGNVKFISKINHKVTSLFYYEKLDRFIISYNEEYNTYVAHLSFEGEILVTHNFTPIVIHDINNKGMLIAKDNDKIFLINPITFDTEKIISKKLSKILANECIKMLFDNDNLYLFCKDKYYNINTETKLYQHYNIIYDESSLVYVNNNYIYIVQDDTIRYYKNHNEGKSLNNIYNIHHMNINNNKLEVNSLQVNSLQVLDVHNNKYKRITYTNNIFE